MGLALILLVGAAGLARALGGTFRALADLPIRGARLAWFALIAQILGAGLAWSTGLSGFYPVGLGLSALAALAFCLRNRRLAGVPLITVGLVLNAVVVSLNGTMPVSTMAAARADVGLSEIAAGDDARHSIAGHGSTWRALGDVIPVPLPLLPEVVSPGDVLVAAGLCELVLLGMRPSRRRGDAARRRSTAVALP